MQDKGPARPLRMLWGVVGICLASVGCQMQISFIDGPPGSTTASRTNTVATAQQDLTKAGSTEQAFGATQAGYLPGERTASMQTPAKAEGPPVVGQNGVAEGQVPGGFIVADRPVPRELNKVSLPPYVIEPPDILLIDAVRLIPLPPYRLEPFDVIQIQVAEALPNEPISGAYSITPEGTINLGYSYGVIRIMGQTVGEAETSIRNHLRRTFKNPQVAVTLVQFRGLQQTRGEHLVRPDGTIGLGIYGAVYVAGMTIPQAKSAIEKHLSQFLLNPEISLDIFAYNSKVFYVITDGAGFGEQVFIFPSTGNETVLDAIGRIYGLPAVASKRKIWVARPAPACVGCHQILPVDWRAITQGGATETNYQIFPGDRVYVKADHLITIDNTLAKIVAPIERLFGVTLLGNATIRSFENNRNGTVPFLGF